VYGLASPETIYGPEKWVNVNAELPENLHSEPIKLSFTESYPVIEYTSNQ
jgi:hypothetical protein